MATPCRARSALLSHPAVSSPVVRGAVRVGSMVLCAAVAMGCGSSTQQVQSGEKKDKQQEEKKQEEQPQGQARGQEEPAKREAPEEAPKKEEPAPAQEDAAPANDEAAPVQEEAAPAQEEAAPANDEAPVQEEAPAQEEAAPAQEEAREAPPMEENQEKKVIDWEAISAKLPTDRTAEEREKRFELFGQFDPNGNGYLSLAEVDKGCHDVLGLYDIFDAKPVVMRAFQAARGANDKRNKTGSHGPDYIEKCEFRLLLVYLRQYFELWQMFDRVDASDDRRVDLDEFKAAVAKIEAWGLQVDDAEAEFKAIDTNDGGKILFDEFASWALAKKLDLEEDDDFEA